MEKSIDTYKWCKVITALLALITLFAGGTIYLLFRPTRLYIFDWIKDAGMMETIELLRYRIFSIPSWMEYTLPDGLWMLSYCLIIGYIWNFKLHRCWVMLVPLLVFAIIFEIGQYIHIIPGTYDRMDIAAYLLAFFIGTIYIVIINKLITTKNLCNNEQEFKVF